MPIGRTDRAPSASSYEIAADGRDLVWALDVRGEYGRLLGKISIRAHGDLATGRLVAETLRLIQE